MLHSGPQERPSIPTELVERLEVASEGSRQLDCEMAVAVGGFFTEPSRYGFDSLDYAYFDAEGARVSPGHGGDQMVPHYTTSLDDALALAARRELDPMLILERAIHQARRYGPIPTDIAKLTRYVCIAILTDAA